MQIHHTSSEKSREIMTFKKHVSLFVSFRLYQVCFTPAPAWQVTCSLHLLRGMQDPSFDFGNNLWINLVLLGPKIKTRAGTLSLSSWKWISRSVNCVLRGHIGAVPWADVPHPAICSSGCLDCPHLLTTCILLPEELSGHQLPLFFCKG